MATTRAARVSGQRRRKSPRNVGVSAQITHLARVASLDPLDVSPVRLAQAGRGDGGNVEAVREGAFFDRARKLGNCDAARAHAALPCMREIRTGVFGKWVCAFVRHVFSKTIRVCLVKTSILAGGRLCVNN